MIVVVAEKPSVARDLAAVLGARVKHNGYMEGNGYQVTWAFGHLVTLKEPGEYEPHLKRWSIEDLPFIPKEFQLKVIQQQGAPEQFNIIRGLIAKAAELVCATDAGREGELIFRYILKLADAERKIFKRLWLSSLTPDAIRAGFDALRPGSDYDRLYAAARCRSEADWIVGLNATRNYTVRHRADGVLWSVGRVQTPVLALIAKRDDEIRNFNSEPYWELQTCYREVLFSFTGERFKKEEEGQAVLQKVEGQPFEIRKIERKQEQSLPPQLHDLTELQREMNRRFGLSAADTLKAAQALYESKFITYPRTDSRYITHDLKDRIAKTLNHLRALKPKEIAALDLNQLPFNGRIVNNSKVTDHHAIIPTGHLPGPLPADQQRVYDTVVTRLIAIFYPPCLKEVTTVEGQSNRISFKAKGIRIVEPGWTALIKLPPASKKKSGTGDGDEHADEDNKDGEQILPAFAVGEQGPHLPNLKKCQTKPPKHYTENTLLGAMETAGRLVDDEQLKEALKEKGLGTPATRAAIIEVLLRRGYIRREKKKLTVTDLGRYLVALVQDPLLKSPELTGEWEGKLKAIENGHLEPDAFMKEIGAYTHRLIQESRLNLDASRTGDCPRCGKPVIRGHQGFGCSGWKEGCGFVIRRMYKEITLSDHQIRELIQRRMSMHPIKLPDGERVVLCLSENGAVMELRQPSKEHQNGGHGDRKRSPAGKPGAGRANRNASAPARGRHDESMSPADNASRKTAPAEDRVVGKCPRCQSDVTERDAFFGCTGFKNGCKFMISKKIAQKKIGIRAVQTLLKSQRTDLIKGFTSKAGKPFDARLKLENGEVRFDFEPR